MGSRAEGAVTGLASLKLKEIEDGARLRRFKSHNYNEREDRAICQKISPPEGNEKIL